MEFDVDVAGKLFPNIWTLLSQWLATGILFLVVKKYLWGPARNFMDKQAELTQQALSEAQGMKEEALKDRNRAKKELAKASSQAQEIVAKGQNEGKVIKDAIIKDGRSEADRLLKSAREEIAYEEAKMRATMQKEIVDVAMAATEKLMSEKVDEQSNRKSIEAMVKELKSNE